MDCSISAIDLNKLILEESEDELSSFKEFNEEITETNEQSSKPCIIDFDRNHLGKDKISKLIDELDETSINKLHSKSLKGNYLILLKNKKFSHIFQNEVRSIQKIFLKEIYEEIKFNLVDLLLDVYSNYSIHRLFCILNNKERISILADICKNFNELATNSIGKFVLQGIFDDINGIEITFLLSEIKSKVNFTSLVYVRIYYLIINRTQMLFMLLRSL